MKEKRFIIIYCFIFMFSFLSVTSFAKNNIKNTEILIKNAKNNFNNGNINNSLHKIYESNYISGLSKCIEFAVQLHLYVDYKKSISIEKNRRLYKCRMQSSANVCSKEKIERINKEMDILKKNAEDDINTFLEHMQDGKYLCDEVKQEAGERIYYDKDFNKKINSFLKNSTKLKLLEKNKKALMSDGKFKNSVSTLFQEIEKWRRPSNNSGESDIIVPAYIVNKL